MNILILKKYLVFPVNIFASKKKIAFSIENKTVYEFNIKLDEFEPNFYSYIDVSRFLGKNIEITITPEMNIPYRQSDVMDLKNLYHEKYRPQIHFTTKNGWLNDPNGLVYLNGVYHMFYQHNPTEPKWDNMHWGHAVSEDMIHWEEKDIALFPNEKGMMYSGSCIIDKQNVSGLGSKEKPAALLFYTSTTPYCQNLAYSLDDFKTIIDYPCNPVVRHKEACNRDPKVIYCDDLKCYLMALYLDEDRYCLLTSENLIKWKELQRIHIKGDNECPDIFYIKDSEGGKKLVLMGAHDRYLVGEFVNGKFVPEQEEKTLHYGIVGYAGQSYSNISNGDVVRVQWDKWRVNTEGFSGQMGLPMKLTLEKLGNESYLCAKPIDQIYDLVDNNIKICNLILDGKDFNRDLDFKPHIFKIKAEYFYNQKLTLNIFGREIILDFEINQISMRDAKGPISLFRDSLDLYIVVDRCSFEFFLDGGKICITAANDFSVMDPNVSRITITSDSKCEIDYLEINSLKSIWE